MRAENGLFVAWGSIDLVFVWVVKIDLVLVSGPRLDFSEGIEINFVCGRN